MATGVLYSLTLDVGLSVSGNNDVSFSDVGTPMFRIPRTSTRGFGYCMLTGLRGSPRAAMAGRKL